MTTSDAILLTVTNCEDFHSVETVVDLLSADVRHPNRIIYHDPARPIPRSLWPACRGVDIFGEGRASEVDGWRFDAYPQWHDEPHTRAAFSFALDRGILIPDSTAIISGDNRLVYASVENLRHWGGIEHREPSIINVDGQLIWHPAALDDIEVIAVSAAGVMYPNYGHFLLDGLPLAYLLANVSEGQVGQNGVAIVCPPLRPWHREILTLLNLDRLVREVQRPTRFSMIVGNSFLSQHVTFPTRYARVIFDALKFVVPPIADAPERIFIVRNNQEGRVMRNHDQLLARMIRRGYTAIVPENYSVREQIQMFSRARLVVGATSAGFANVGFSPPGAKVFEIVAECHPDQWMRRLSLMLGHRWHGYIHTVDHIAGQQIGAKFFPLYDISFELPLDDFENALSVVEGT